MTDWQMHWRTDIDWLAAELPLRHPNLFHVLPAPAFQARITQLQADLPDCDDAMVITRLMAVTAALGDAHTALIPPVSHYLPLDCYGFAEGLHIVTAPADRPEWLGARILALEGQPIAEVLAALSTIIAHENQSFLLSQLPAYFKAVNLLYGLEICDRLDAVQLTLQARDQSVRSVILPTVRHKNLGSGSIRLGEEPGKPEPGDAPALPLYRRQRAQSLWFMPIAPDRLYVQYNTCRIAADSAAHGLFAQLLEQLRQRPAATVILDVRHNLGGDSTLLDPVIDELAHQRRPLFVIIGRDTFSSALLNALALQTRAGAVLVGEPSGGKPNCYGEVQYLTLPHARLRIRYSTRYYHLVDDDSLPSLMPDLPCPVTLADYLAGQDPCLAAILKQT